MRLSVALDNSLFKEGGPLGERKWSGGGISIQVSIARCSCSETESLVIAAPSIMIGQHYWNLPLENDIDEFVAHLAEARTYMDKMQRYIETKIAEAVAEMLKA